MLIVGQDRETVVNFENITRIKFCKYNSENHIQCDFIYGNYEDLGIYKTEERAKEILQEIALAYVKDRKANETDNFFGFQFMGKDIYYEMPKE